MESKYDEFQCTVCAKFIVSPVQTCANGHKVCGICLSFYKVKTCGLCQGPLSPADALEKIIQSTNIEIRCRNAQKGCERSIKITEMKDHVTNVCEYRQIACPCRGNNNCDVKCIVLKDLFDHLENVHGIQETWHENGYFQYQQSLSIYNSTATKITCAVRFDEKVFLVSTTFQKGSLCFWAAIIGDNGDADRYRFQIPFKATYSGTVGAPFTDEFAVDCPVNPIHNSRFDKVKRKGDFVAIPRSNLREFFEELEEPGKKPKIKFTWNFVHKIIKV